MKESELYEEMAAYIEKNGWIQNDFYGEGGSACMLGARYRVKSQILGNMLGGVQSRILASLTGGSIPTWNDTPGRTKQEVLDKLHEAAKLAMKMEEGIE